MAMSSDHFCLKWNNFHNSIVSAFESLQSSEDLVDVTLMCEGRNVKAHKVILSACSPYFRNLFKETPCQHPIIILKDVLHCDLIAILQFMYQGEVLITQDGLASFLKTAELLQVSGLAGNTTPGAIPSSAPENAIIPTPSAQPAPPLVPMPVASPSSPPRSITKPPPETVPPKPAEKEIAPKKDDKQLQQLSRFEPETEPIQSCSYQPPEAVVIKRETEDQDFEDMDYSMMGQENIDDPEPATEEQSILERSLKAQGQHLLGGFIQKNKIARSRVYITNCPFCNLQLRSTSLNRHLINTCKQRILKESSKYILQSRTRSGSSPKAIGTLQSVLKPNPAVTTTPTLTAKPTVTPNLTVTFKPAVTSTYTVTPKPTVTSNQVVTQKYSLTPNPASKPNPELTLKSTVTSNPTVTPNPAFTSKPTVTPNLATTPKYYLTPNPEGSPKYILTLNTEITPNPNLTPNNTVTPKITTPKPQVIFPARRKSRLASVKKLDDEFEYY